MSLQHILKNSSVSGKEPLASQLANGELSINYHADGPFLCCKDTAGNVRRVAGVWVSATAPSTPFPGELWLDTGITPSQLKVYKDSTDAWVFAGEVNTATTTTEGIVRLATNAEAQGGTSTTSAVTPAALQSKISDSTSTTSSTTIASSTAVKTVADTIGAALPKSGGTITGILEIGNAGQLRFEGSSADAYETTLAVEDPTATRTITLPDRSGTVITTGDTGTITSTMIADGTIVNADINANAEIAVSKLADGAARQLLQTDAAGTGVEWTSNVNIPGTLDVTGATALDSTLSVPAGSAAAPSINFAGDNTGIYSPGEDQLALSTGGTARLFVGSTGNVGIGTTAPNDDLEIRDSVAAIRITDTDTNQHTRIVQDFDTTQIINTGAGSIRFSNNGNERLRIDSSGRLGLGTSSPAAPLTVVRNGTVVSSGLDAQTVLTVQSTGSAGSSTHLNILAGSTGATGQAVLTFGDADNPGIGAIRYRHGDDSLAIETNAAERLRIDSSGFISIGGDTDTGIYSPGANQLAISTGGAARLFVDTGGSVGVGVSSFTTGEKLKVFDGSSGATSINGLNSLVVEDSADNGIAILNPNSNIGSIAFGDNDNGAIGRIRYFHSSDAMMFQTNGSERFRIDSSGRLLVGTSSNLGNQEVLQVNSTSVANVFGLYRQVADNAGPRFSLVKTRGSATSSVSTGDLLGTIRFQGSDGTDTNSIGGAIDCAVDGTPGLDDMPSRLVFLTSSSGSATPTERLRIDSSGTTTLTSATSTAPFIATVGSSEVARIDGGGRLLIGKSTGNSVGGTLPLVQVDGSDARASISITRRSNDTGQSLLVLVKTRSTDSSAVAVQENDVIGEVRWSADDGTDLNATAAVIRTRIDGAVAANDLPGRLEFLTTVSGDASPTECLRITSDGVHAYNQKNPVAVNTTATLTVDDLKTGIITSTTAAAVTMTLPTGTDTEAGFSGMYGNMTFEWSVINTGATNAVTVSGNTDHTLTGSGTVAASTSGRFASRRTGSNTFVTYRLS